MKATKLIFCVFLLTSCLSDYKLDTLNNDFKIGYVELSRYRNIYYQDQGLFHRKCVYSVIVDDQFIYVKTHPFNKQNTLVKDSSMLFVIDLEKYKLQPDQENSPGILGPFKEEDFKNSTLGRSIKNEDWLEYPFE